MAPRPTQQLAGRTECCGAGIASSCCALRCGTLHVVTAGRSRNVYISLSASQHAVNKQQCPAGQPDACGRQHEFPSHVRAAGHARSRCCMRAPRGCSTGGQESAQLLGRPHRNSESRQATHACMHAEITRAARTCTRTHGFKSQMKSQMKPHRPRSRRITLNRQVRMRMQRLSFPGRARRRPRATAAPATATSFFLTSACIDGQPICACVVTPA